MSVRRECGAGQAARGHGPWSLFVALLAGTLAVGCEAPFEPFQENGQGPFSIFGYLDVQADTQWIRVTPIRQNLVAGLAPIDAVVTLQKLQSGRTLTLRDSLFEFVDVGLGSTGYAHNFWTTEPIERGATYRLEALRSDGAATTALIETPPEAEVVLSYYEGPPDVVRGDTVRFRKPLRIHVQGEYLLYSDAVYMVQDLVETPPRDSAVVRQSPTRTDPGAFEFTRPDSLIRHGLLDLSRVEMRIGVAPFDWPYNPDLSPAEAVLPGRAPSNVENGFGFVGGVATWSIPLPLCDPQDPRPDGQPTCGHVVGAASTSITGRLVTECVRPRSLPDIVLTEEFAGGGTAIFDWHASWKGTYAFEGLEAGADIALNIQGASTTVRVPALTPGERYVVPDVPVRIDCAPVADREEPSSRG